MVSKSKSKNTSGGRSSLPLIVIVGETGSGKSDLAMGLAKELGGEIICADSRTIYKGMDIGTAKPTKQDQKQVPHHMLDIVDLGESFNVSEFKHQAEAAIGDIRSRGKLPIMVGGTGLYVDSVVFDYQFRNKYNKKIREALETKTLEELTDLAIEAGFAPSDLTPNRRHLIRLIETGSNSPSNRNKTIPNVMLLGLSIRRSNLRRNIENRVELMFRAGLRKEVDELVKRYGWEHEALTGIGYSEFRSYYDSKSSISKVKRDIVQNTLKFAKRQRTWFKRNQQIKWFENADEAFNFVVQAIKQLQ